MNLNADLNLQATRRSTKDMPMKMNPTCGHRGHRGQKRFALLVALAMTAVPLAAQAQRKSPLADAPAIRKRYELRATRLEVGAGLGTTLNQDFYHTVFFNLKIGFHLNDWLSIAGFGSFGIANIATTFQNDLVSSLNEPALMNQLPSEPTKTEAQASMQKIKYILGAQLEFTPFTGKYSLAGKLFANYDFYAFAGPGIINVQPTDSSSLTDCGSVKALPPTATGGPGGPFSCAVTGSKIGANFGLGLHSYFNEWMALNIELRDLLAQLNPSGRDVNGDGVANNSDLSWSHTFMVTANLVFYLPATASISP
jgi:outer membrane beta-barrel protein